jgi:hypothetical protein
VKGIGFAPDRPFSQTLYDVPGAPKALVWYERAKAGTPATISPPRRRSVLSGPGLEVSDERHRFRA